jgi:hypothetical protein
MVYPLWKHRFLGPKRWMIVDDSGGIPPLVNGLYDSCLHVKWRFFVRFDLFGIFIFSSIKFYWKRNKKS